MSERLEKTFEGRDCGAQWEEWHSKNRGIETTEIEVRGGYIRVVYYPPVAKD